MCFSIKTIFDNDKKNLIYMIDFFMSNRKFTTEHVKIVENYRFSRIFFFLKC